MRRHRCPDAACKEVTLLCLSGRDLAGSALLRSRITEGATR